MGSVVSSLFGGDAYAEGNDSSDSSLVVKYHSPARWQLYFHSIKDTSQLIVVDFAASWCGPCRMIEPAIIDMASKFTDVGFAKIDVDELPDVAKEWGVQAMPTFVLIKRGKEVDRIVGAKKDELEKKIQKHKS